MSDLGSYSDLTQAHTDAFRDQHRSHVHSFINQWLRPAGAWREAYSLKAILEGLGSYRDKIKDPIHLCARDLFRFALECGYEGRIEGDDLWLKAKGFYDTEEGSHQSWQPNVTLEQFIEMESNTLPPGTYYYEWKPNRGFG